MYLLFETDQKSLHYAAFNNDSEMLYEDTLTIDGWNWRSVQMLFSNHMLPKLRAHGALFTRIGIVVPFADPKFEQPLHADMKSLRQLMTTPLQKRVLQPTDLVMQASHKAWPHLPQYFLFDTHLSSQLGRQIALPPFDYDTTKALNLHPMLLHSYGHKANMAKTRIRKGPVISLYLADQASAAVFEGEAIRDATITYSPLSPLFGLNTAGAFDAGFYLELAHKKSGPSLESLLLDKAGVQPMTETKHTLETLLQIAGLVPRTDSFLIDDYSIETIEWIELSLMTYIRSLRHGLGALRTYSSEIHTIIVNSNVLSQSSRFWPLLLKGGLEDMKISFADMTLLQAACHDLMKVR